MNQYTMIPKKRLDHYLAEKYPEISRAFLQKLCNSNQVLVNNKPEKSGFKLKPEDKVEVLYDMAAIDKIDDIELPILFEDNAVVVINKPVGVISHARGRHWNEPSVASFIRQLTHQSGERAGIVHRLDRATSGVMICAKDQKTFAYLQKQFADRKVVKTYIAVVNGQLEPPKAVIDMPIERNPKAPATFRVGANGKPAKTEYKVLQSTGKYTTLELKPLTGRTHQLRVHLAHQGHPIVGDDLYRGEPAKRLFLHAYELTLKFPDKTLKTFQAPLPSIFKSLMKKTA